MKQQVNDILEVVCIGLATVILGVMLYTSISVVAMNRANSRWLEKEADRTELIQLINMQFEQHDQSVLINDIEATLNRIENKLDRLNGN